MGFTIVFNGSFQRVRIGGAKMLLVLLLVPLPIDGTRCVDIELSGQTESGVIHASPVLIGASLSQGTWSCVAPAALNMAPQTPPPNLQVGVCSIENCVNL